MILNSLKFLWIQIRILVNFQYNGQFQWTNLARVESRTIQINIHGKLNVQQNFPNNIISLISYNGGHPN